MKLVITREASETIICREVAGTDRLFAHEVHLSRERVRKTLQSRS
jgi:hypothetical protein